MDREVWWKPEQARCRGVEGMEVRDEQRVTMHPHCPRQPRCPHYPRVGISAATFYFQNCVRLNDKFCVPLRMQRHPPPHAGAVA